MSVQSYSTDGQQRDEVSKTEHKPKSEGPGEHSYIAVLLTIFWTVNFRKKKSEEVYYYTVVAFPQTIF